MTANLYRTIWIPADGYVVYRHSFDEAKCSIIEGALAHKQAIFVEEIAAKDYCRYRNALIDEGGTDELVS